MSPYAQTLTALKVTVRRRGDPHTLAKALSPGEEAHGTSGFAPFETSAAENIIEPFGLSGTFDLPTTRHTQRFNTLRYTVPGAAQVSRSKLQIGQPTVGTGADERRIEG